MNSNFRTATSSKAPFGSRTEALEHELAPYCEFKQRLWGEVSTSPRFRLLYPTYLIQTYQYVRLTSTILNTAATKLNSSRNVLSEYLARHAREEQGHDEMLLRDLGALGIERSVALRIKGSRSVIALAGIGLYAVNCDSPVGSIGYAYALETLPPERKALDRLRQQHGISMESLSTLYLHAASDTRHSRELSQLIDSELYDFEFETVRHFALLTASQSAEWIEEFAEDVLRG